MHDLWLGDVGIRVTNLEKSIDFYTKVFDLEEIDRGGDVESTYVLFKDRHSGQRLELNWYAESNPFWAPYVVGESLDHFEVRVKSVPETMERLKKLGILPATKKLWVNRPAVAKLKEDPKFRKLMEEDVWLGRSGHRIVYIQDPDGIFFCLYDHPEEEWAARSQTTTEPRDEPSSSVGFLMRGVWPPPSASPSSPSSGTWTTGRPRCSTGSAGPASQAARPEASPNISAPRRSRFRRSWRCAATW